MDNILKYTIIILLVLLFINFINNKNEEIEQKNFFDIKKRIMYRPFDMGIKMNLCSYKVLDRIKLDENIKMFDRLLSLLLNLGYDKKVLETMIKLKYLYNKPIGYGFKGDNDLELYLYNGDHNLSGEYGHSKTCKCMHSKNMMIKKLNNILNRDILLSNKMNDFIKNNYIFAISLNIDKDGKINDKLNIYTENKKNTKSKVFNYDIKNDKIQYSNYGKGYMKKDDIKEIKNINKYPDGDKYIVHNKENNTNGLYVINPKKEDIIKFLNKSDYDKKIKEYFINDIDNKSLDIAYNIKNDELVRVAIYDVY